MNIIWEIDDNDVNSVRDFVTRNQNAFVVKRISRNINRQNIQVDKDSVLKNIIMCLLTSQQRSGPNTPVSVFLRQNPFPLTEQNMSQHINPETFIRETLQENGLNRYINRIPKFFTENYNILHTTNWQLIEDLRNNLNEQSTKETERVIADMLHDTFSGFGPKQSRNFLQALGLTKYEIPIDSRIITWLNGFGFPVTLSSTALQDKGYYHFVSDGIQTLCERADTYPCILDAVIFSSYDNGQWTEENTIY